MVNTVIRNFDTPDERREFPGGVLDLISVGALTFGREIQQPGWRWSKDIKPIVGTERCEYHHVGYQVRGRWMVEDRDGTQHEIRPGDVYDTPPGHDSWVIGDEPSESVDFQGIAGWASRGAAPRILTTVVFADIVDSTALIDRIGDAAWRQLQAQFLENVQSVLSTWGGTLVNTAGDGVLMQFDSPLAAVRAGSALAVAADRIGLQLRSGVHTGEVERTGDSLTGLTVHVAARVMAEAGPGEIFVTSTTHDLTLDRGLAYEDRGQRELKGVPGARTLYRLRDPASGS